MQPEPGHADTEPMTETTTCTECGHAAAAHGHDAADGRDPEQRWCADCDAGGWRCDADPEA